VSAWMCPSSSHPYETIKRSPALSNSPTYSPLKFDDKKIS
jgi:hypothetical protein